VSSPNTDQRGLIIENLIDDNNFVVLNNGQSTYTNYTVNHKKVHSFDFYNKFVKCSPNVIIFGRNIALSILCTVAYR